jgi:hypothetical protein
MVALLLLSGIGCGGSSSVSPQQAAPSFTPTPLRAPGGFPPPPPVTPGPRIHGTVRMPSGQIVQRERSLLERFAGLLIGPAIALTGDVSPVGANVRVALSLRRSGGSVQSLDTTFTDDQGEYEIDLPPGTSADTCRFIVSVGAGVTLTRAFVFSTTEPIDIDFAAEAAVALVLGQVNPGADLCTFSPETIQQLVDKIRDLPGNVSGRTAYEINSNAVIAAANDPTLCIEIFPNPCTPPGRQMDGRPCNDGAQCSTGYCIDGVCCGSPACPLGQRCDIFDTAGTCRPRQVQDSTCRTDGDCASENCEPGPPAHCGAPRPQPTATAVPSPPFLQASTTAAEPGMRVTISVTLRAPHSLVAGTQNDLQFDPDNAPIAARANGKPDCSPNPDINKAATAFAFFAPPGCRDTACTSIRALVLSTENIDPIIDGSVLFTCTVNVSASATNGRYPLALSGVIFSSPEGNAIPGAYGSDGAIVVGD